MPRKTTKSLERKVNPDRRYQSILVQRLINKSMLNGKKLPNAQFTLPLKVQQRSLVLRIQLKFLKKLSPTFLQILKLNLAVLVVQTTRFHSQFPDTVRCTSPSHGSLSLLVLVRVCHTNVVLKQKSLTLTMQPVLPLRRKKTHTAWLKLTVLSHTLLAANQEYYEKHHSGGVFLLQNPY